MKVFTGELLIGSVDNIPILGVILGVRPGSKIGSRSLALQVPEKNGLVNSAFPILKAFDSVSK